MYKKILTHNIYISQCSRATQTENPTQHSAVSARLQAEETLSPGLPAPAPAREQSPPPSGTTTSHQRLVNSLLPAWARRSKTKRPPDNFLLEKFSWLSVVLKIKCKAAQHGGQNEGGKQTLLHVNLVRAKRLQEGI